MSPSLRISTLFALAAVAGGCSGGFETENPDADRSNDAAADASIGGAAAEGSGGSAAEPGEEDACEVGASKLAEDGCNECICQEGLDGQAPAWACTGRSCEDSVECQAGANKIEDCNECVCVDGAWACDDRDCDAVPPEPGSCDDGNTLRADGETWEEGCNTCSCSSGTVACTEMMCVPSEGPECGGTSGATCSSGHVCIHSDQSCGTSGAGYCVPMPPMCMGGMSSAVCGCDGKQYSSRCTAHAAGVDFSSDVAPTCTNYL